MLFMIDVSRSRFIAFDFVTIVELYTRRRVSEFAFASSIVALLLVFYRLVLVSAFSFKSLV